MLATLLAEFGPYIVVVLGALGAFFGYTRSIKKNAKREVVSEIETAAKDEYVADRKVIDNATPIDTSAANARDRLRKRQSNRHK